MAKRIVIAGAGGFGRGVYGWLISSPRHSDAHHIEDVAFIDDGFPAVSLPAKLIGTIRGFTPLPNDEVICALGSPRVRRTVVETLKATGAIFHTFIDDRAIIGHRSTIGEGSVICPGVVVSADATVGSHVHVNFNCSIGHDVVLGDFTTLSPSVNIMGEVRVGEGVFLGGSAVVLPRISLSEEGTIGAGAIVTKCTPPAVIVKGVPGSW